MDWIDGYAEQLGGDGSSLAIGDDERRILLQLAREVAHGTERFFAPLSTYLAGRFVHQRASQGMSPPEAAREALEVARRLLPRSDE